MNVSKRVMTFGTLAFTLIVGFMLGQAGHADSGSVPGSADDPIVTKSYVDGKLGTGGGGGTSSATGYKVLELQSGQTLKASTEQGLEVILRSGQVYAVSGTLGDLSDVTSGQNITNGASLQLDHLLIFARNDGRGVKISGSGTSFVLVRGAYTIQ